jgi:hypothetical protein
LSEEAAYLSLDEEVGLLVDILVVLHLDRRGSSPGESRLDGEGEPFDDAFSCFLLLLEVVVLGLGDGGRGRCG